MIFKNIKSQKSLLVIFNIISCLTIIIFAIIIYQQSKTNKNYNDWVRHTYEILGVAHQVLNRSSEMESSYRGYFLTGEESFLVRIPKAQTNISSSLDYLTKVTSDNYEQQNNILQIKDLVAQFTEIQEQQKHIYKNYGSSGLLIADIKVSQGAMQDLRQVLANFINIETQKLERRLRLEQEEQLQQVSTIIIGTVISVLGLVVSNILITLLISIGATASQKLETIKELYQLVLDNMNDGLFEYNFTDNQVTFSPSYKRQLGYKEDDPLTLDDGFNQLLHPDDRERVWQEIKQFMAQKVATYSTVYRLRHRNGSWLWMLSRAVGTWNKEDQLQRMVGVHTDITAQKKHEEALKELNSEIESFTYIASHDLRSPLVNLKGFTQEIKTSLGSVKNLLNDASLRLTPQENMIINEAFDKEIPECLGFIDSAVERMDILTSAILNLSRIGRRVYKLELINVQEIVQRCLNSLNYELNTHNTTVKLGELPEFYADELSVEQIFSNIIENAVKYLDPERAGTLHIDGIVQNDEAMYTIQDNGRGIEEKDTEKVFSIFRRARNVKDVRGVGMGLAFVKATIRKMGGRIWYESELNRGTTFYVLLPNRKPKEPTNELQ